MKKMSKQEVLAYTLVAILALVITFGFLKIFSFEDSSDKDKNNNPITEDLVKELTNYIPNYRYYYNKYSNLTINEIGKVVYNYILNNKSNILVPITIDDFNGLEIDLTNIEPLSRLSQEDFLETAHYLFGQNEEVNLKDFSIDNNIKAIYINNSFLIYKVNDSEDIVYQEAKEYTKYEITDEGNTLIIFDRYVKCDITNDKCYKDSELRYPNSYNFIKDGEVVINKASSKAQSYKHTFKLENNHYVWYSSELDD